MKEDAKRIWLLADDLGNTQIIYRDHLLGKEAVVLSNAVGILLRLGGKVMRGEKGRAGIKEERLTEHVLRSRHGCRLEDEGSEVHAVEEGEDPQALLVRVGPVFYPGGEGKEPGVWITYQDHYMSSGLAGPVLLTPQVWKELDRAVRRRLGRPWWRPW